MMILIVLTALFAALILIVEHYAPWFRRSNNDRPHPVYNYVLGCLALFLPYSSLLIYWGLFCPGISPFLALAALWAVMGVGGAAVGGCYLYDDYMDNRRKRAEMEARESQYRVNLTKPKGAA